MTAVIPTLGSSPLLPACLEALRKDGGRALEIVVVHQGSRALKFPDGLVDQLCRTKVNLGFTGGTNLGIAASQAPFVATVNDDALVEEGWTRALVAALQGDPHAACAQGVNLMLDRPHLTDGHGVGWNRSWQAVQLGHGEQALDAQESCREIFGTSATAALYRRQSLDEVAGEDGFFFDPALGSYYEDVDLACRLRALGWRALLVPGARARHAGSATGRHMGARRLQAIYGNRYRVLAGVLGRSFWGLLPRIVARDLLDAVQAVRRRDSLAVRGAVQGCGRGLGHLARCGHFRAPRLPLPELRRFQG